MISTEGSLKLNSLLFQICKFYPVLIKRQILQPSHLICNFPPMCLMFLSSMMDFRSAVNLFKPHRSSLVIKGVALNMFYVH